MAIRPRWTVGRLMLGVAAAAVLLAAGIYRRDHADVDRATLGLRLRDARSADPTARRFAVEELGKTDLRDAPAAGEALAALLAGDPDPTVRRAAARAMGSILNRAMRARADSAVAAAARARAAPPVARAIGDPDEDDVPVPVLVRAMADADPTVRLAAVSAWVPLPRDARFAARLAAPAAAALDRLLLDPDPAVRAMALRALPRLDAPPGGRGRIVTLMEGDPDPAVRCGAVGVLIQLWPAADLYPLLLDRHRLAPTPEERSTVAWGFAGLPAPPPEVIPALLALMETDPIAVDTIPQAMARLGRAGRPWLGPLGRAADRELAEPEGTTHAARAVVAIDPDSPEAQSLLDPLARRLRDSQSWPGQQAAEILKAYGPAAAPAVPTIREALLNPSDFTRQRAAALLGRVGPAALPAVADLERLARSDLDPFVRAAAGRAIPHIRIQPVEIEVLPVAP